MLAPNTTICQIPQLEFVTRCPEIVWHPHVPPLPHSLKKWNWVEHGDTSVKQRDQSEAIQRTEQQREESQCKTLPAKLRYCDHQASTLFKSICRVISSMSRESMRRVSITKKCRLCKDFLPSEIIGSWDQMGKALQAQRRFQSHGDPFDPLAKPPSFVNKTMSSNMSN